MKNLLLTLSALAVGSAYLGGIVAVYVCVGPLAGFAVSTLVSLAIAVTTACEE